MNAPNRSIERARGTSDPPELRSPRQRVLLSLIADGERAISTTELARLTGQTLGATAHHVRALVRMELIEWAGERRARGALQTFYRATEAGLAALRRPRTEALLMLVGTRASYDRHAPAVPCLDAEAERDLEKLVQAIRPQVEGIVAQATARAADTGSSPAG